MTVERQWSLPVSNVLVLEVAGGIGLVLLAVHPGWWPGAVAVAVLGVVVASARRHGRWLIDWLSVMSAFHARSHHRMITLSPTSEGPAAADADTRVELLRLLMPDLVVARGTDHRHQAIAFAWHDGTCTAVLAVETSGGFVGAMDVRTSGRRAGPPSANALPLRALAGCLEQRGVVLDSIQVISRAAGGGTARDSGAAAAYRQIVGMLPAVARRSTWVSVRLDPERCTEAVRERGGGTPGTHRALLAAVARVQSVLEGEGLVARVLDSEELLRASLTCAELTRTRGSGTSVHLRERWRSVSVGGIGHRSFAIAGWPGSSDAFDAVAGVRTRSTTLALGLVAGADGDVALRGVLRLSGSSPSELDRAGQQLTSRAQRAGVALTPLDGQQVAALGTSLPMSGAA